MTPDHPGFSDLVDGLLERAYMDCPSWRDDTGAQRCGLPAEVISWWVHGTSGHPAEHAKIRCPLGHWFAGTVESLTF